MKKYMLAIILVLFGGTVFAVLQKRGNIETPEFERTGGLKEMITPTVFGEFTANFEIYTNGTKRVFTNGMYHNLSESVFITSEDPSEIIVKKAGSTWSDFFDSLPMSINNECLITGKGQKFCNNESKSLKFYINDSEDLGVLEKEIQPDDFLKVVYE